MKLTNKYVYAACALINAITLQIQFSWIIAILLAFNLGMLYYVSR